MRESHRGLLALESYGEGHLAAGLYVIEAQLTQGLLAGSGCGRW
ncbi:hypothetical protein PZB75_30815 (plasmid) [Streptomyces sp. AM 4-1-1]|nr:hypothetical protein [Streptomyces sp. AM 4-1-1]WEH37797.1 hypothetical protein PZB75_30815 [Streptomyces sp. AM 4-1-1]